MASTLDPGINVSDTSKPFSFETLGTYSSSPRVSTISMSGSNRPSYIAETKISERQKEWDVQARNADEKQAELFHTQWNLIREQTSTFSKDLIHLRTELKNLKEEVQRCFSVSDEARDTGDDSLQSQIEALRIALEQETLLRTTQCSEIEKGLAGLRSGLDRATNQQTVLERSVMNVSDEIRHSETRLRADLEAETRARQDVSERLRLELEQASAATSRNFDTLSRRIESSIEELQEAIRRETATRISQIQEKVAINAEEIERITREQRTMIEREFSERRSSDGALTIQIHNILGTLEKERAERETIFNSFRSQFSDFKQDLNAQNPEHSIRELRTMIEAEAKKRAEGDQDASVALSRLQATLEGETRERARILPEVADRLKVLGDAIDAEASKRATRITEIDNALRMMIDQEIKTRAADRVHSDDEYGRLRAELDMEVRSRQEAIARAAVELKEALKPLGDAINREIQDRHAGDEEAVRMALQAKQSCEKEAHDRALDHSATMDAIKELSRSLDHEKTDREKSDNALHSQIAETRQDLDAEKGERREEAAAQARAIRSVEMVATTGLKDLRTALDVEAGERKELNLLMLNMSRVQTQLETETRELARFQGELSDRLRGVSDSLGHEATERKDADAQIERTFRELSLALDQEARQREQMIQVVKDSIRAEILARESGDEAAAKNLSAAMAKMEGLMEKLREVLWAKMVTLADRLMMFGREWRETPPGADISSSQVVVGAYSVIER